MTLRRTLKLRGDAMTLQRTLKLGDPPFRLFRSFLCINLSSILSCQNEHPYRFLVTAPDAIGTSFRHRRAMIQVIRRVQHGHFHPGRQGS